ncbi:SG2A1 protein, partial [Crocuta crocuta]
MKLLSVLVLVALPLYCFAGSGCPFLDQLVSKAIDPQVSIPEFQTFLEKVAQTPEKQQAVADLKQCFLNQSNETLKNFGDMMVITVSSDVLSN